MDALLQHDLDRLPELLHATADRAAAFLASLATRPAGQWTPHFDHQPLPQDPQGATAALDLFYQRFDALLTASPGPRYFGFVTGGATPASLAGDWLTSAFDQNNAGGNDGAAPYLEREAIAWLLTLFHLPADFTGTFVTGATLSNFTGLAQARQWYAAQHHIDASRDGLWNLPPLPVLSGAPHSCIDKVLSELGIGRHCIRRLPVLPGRDAVDIHALRQALEALDGKPAIVVGNAGTVNTVDFDDLRAIAALRREFNFWFHIDAAFGGFASTSPRFASLIEGWQHADSIAVDLHKWLNVPYDSAVQFTRHQDLQYQVFQNNAVYLDLGSNQPEFVHLTPENSRRLRALPTWMTLAAYGAGGVRDVVERNCDAATAFAAGLTRIPGAAVLAPVRMNVVCFALDTAPTADLVNKLQRELTLDGRVFLTPTHYAGRPGLRAAFSNWRTESADVQVALQALADVAARLA